MFIFSIFKNLNNPYFYFYFKKLQHFSTINIYRPNVQYLLLLLVSYIKVIHKVRQLGGARITASFGIIGHQMQNWERKKILQNEVTETQTSNFHRNFGGKLSFILSFLFSWAPPLLLHICSLVLPVQLL